VKKGDLILVREPRAPLPEKRPLGGNAVRRVLRSGECTTVWAPGAQVCIWRPTGKDIRGRPPVRDIARHSSRDFAIPQDV